MGSSICGTLFTSSRVAAPTHRSGAVSQSAIQFQSLNDEKIRADEQTAVKQHGGWSKKVSLLFNPLANWLPWAYICSIPIQFLPEPEHTLLQNGLDSRQYDRHNRAAQ